MAGIKRVAYRSKDGKKKVKYYITYYDEYGKQHTSGKSYPTKTEAQYHLHEYKDRINDDLTIKDIFHYWQQKVIKMAQGTQYNYKVNYNKYIKPIENKRYDKLSIMYLQRYIDDIEYQNPNSASYVLKMCKAAVNYCIKKRLLTENKFNYIDSVKVQRQEIHHLDIEQIKDVLDIAKKLFSYKTYTILYLFIGTGLRSSELFALNKSDIDLNNLSVRVNKQCIRTKLQHKTKTDKSNRVIYIFPDLADVLREYIKTVEGDILFPNEKGGYIDGNNFNRRTWTNIKEYAGITQRVRLHDLRGSYIDMVLSSGLSPKFAQNQVGHSKTETTLNVYARNNDDMVNTAQFVIDSIFSNKEKNKEKNSEVGKSNIIPFPKKQTITG